MSNGFITKIDYSNNRQIKQGILTDTTLSGSTILGVPFLDLPNGPNPNISGVTESLGTTNGTFSGNTGTTIFNFNDTRLTLASNSLSAITPSNSGLTQSTGNIFTGSITTIIDGNSVNLAYSGVNYNLIVTGMTDIGGGSYSGGFITTNTNVLSADTLDYTGRTIWCQIPGILSVDNIIETNNIVLTGDLSACTGTIYATSFSGCSPMNLYGVMELDNGVATVFGDLVVLGDFKISGGSNTELHTETIVAEDNNIELNYNGNHNSANGGGITILSGQTNSNSKFSINQDGWWVSEPGVITNEYTPSGSTDSCGHKGLMTWDDDNLYIKTNVGWKKISLTNL